MSKQPRLCVVCGGPLPAGAGSRRKSCSKEHEKARLRAYELERSKRRRGVSAASQRQINAHTRQSATRSGEPWGERDEAMLRAHPEMSAQELALALGRSYSAVNKQRMRLRRAGYDARQIDRSFSPWTLEEEDYLQQHPDITHAAAAEHLGRTPRAVEARRYTLRKEAGRSGQAQSVDRRANE